MARYGLCLIWSSVSEPIIIVHTSARAVMHATLQCMLARYSFEGVGDIYFFQGRASKTCLLLCPRLTDRVLLLLRKTCTYRHTRYQLSHVKHLFACFGHSSISHAQNPLPTRPRGAYPKK